MSQPHRTSSNRYTAHSRSTSRVRPIAAALVGLLAVGCISRTLANDGLEAIPAPMDAGSVGNMIVTPYAAALGQRILRFDNRGTVKERADRRKGAEQTMATTCSNHYRSGAEGPAALNGVVTPRPDEATHDASQFWYVQYVCVRNEQDAPAGG